jgi:hypothetical protein
MAYTNIDDPSAYFTATLYTGNSSANHAITNDANAGDFQPDMLWYKSQSYGSSHILYDSSRTKTYFFTVNTTAKDKTDANMLDSFDTNGFTLNADLDGNRASNTFMAWQWKCNGGTTSTNNDGAVTSTVQVNSDAGFSILTYTMNSNSNETVGHGLGVAPDVVITKARERNDSNGFWSVYTTSIDGSLDYLKLNTEGQKNNSSLAAPTSTVFTGAGSSTAAYRSFAAYCFHSVKGYSKFGSYLGNGLTDGAFVYTGFKPAFVILKKYNTSDDSWVILDNQRDPYNVVNSRLFADLVNSESTSTDMVDFLSNGFKLRTSGSAYNGSGIGYFYMAFAENPFVTSTGVPCTAR